MIIKQNSNSEKIKIINKWETYTNNFELLLFDDDILTLITVIDETLSSYRKGFEKKNLLELYINLMKKANEKINKNFIDFFEPKIRRKTRNILVKNQNVSNFFNFKKYKKKDTLTNNIQKIIFFIRIFSSPKIY